jgi:KipI family sensor histidine kinase inhibitor
VSLRVIASGDSALVVEFEDRIDRDISARAVALAESIAAERIGGVRDVVPTYRSVAIYFDPLRVEYDRLRGHLDRFDPSALPSLSVATQTIRIPVCYGGELGPDLGDLAGFAGMTEAEAIALHAAPAYRVFMLGFIAGFAYMGTVDARIAMPRHATPRVRVPSGSVGIAGVQTGIYPTETPGGWRLIGRTPVKPFDPARREPFLMKAGDTVRFYAITRAEYDAWPSS